MNALQQAVADPRPVEPIDVLVVASWFPTYADPANGRFVADQVDALASSGFARPIVVSFDRTHLSGGAGSRADQAAIVSAAGAAAVRASPRLFVDRVPGLDPAVPVARLVIADGLTRSAGRAHAAAHRAVALSALADRLLRDQNRASGTRPGVVHAHTGYPDGAAAMTLADRLGWPLFVTEHASFIARQLADPEIRASYAALLATTERLYAVGTMLADELRAAFPAHARTIEVLPNAIPMDSFPVVGLADRSRDELLYVGYRVASKGIETLLRAVATVRARRPSVTLRLVGRAPDPDLDRHWLSLASELGIADIVTFEGSSDRAGVAAAMGRASIFVHPSPRETFGVVAVEALATGMPVVATDSGGVTEVMGTDPGQLGAIVPREDPRALATAIVDTLERRDRFDPARLRAAVEERFGAGVIAGRLLSDYESALTNRPPGARPRRIVLPEPTQEQRADRLVIVALDRATARSRLGPIPRSVRSSLALLVAKEPADLQVPAVGHLVEVDVSPMSGVHKAAGLRGHGGTVGRLARLVADPIGTLNRRLGRGPGSRQALAPATRAVARLARDLGPIEVIPVDGHDYLAVEPVLSTGAIRLSGGGIAWLMDDLGTIVADSPRTATPDSPDA